MQVVVLTDILEKVADYFRHGVEIGCILGFVLRIGLLRRTTKYFVGFPMGFLAVTAAVPLTLAFGAAFERLVCPVAFGASLLSGFHCRKVVKTKRQEIDRTVQQTVRRWMPRKGVLVICCGWNLAGFFSMAKSSDRTGM